MAIQINALDSNIVSYELKGLFDIREKLEAAVCHGDSFVISEAVSKLQF
jgi:uncharacterized protein YsxB (DUF464 family)